ncbi:MAG TPA: energy-coupling factor transporter transmembrane protein EcfT [Methanosphaera sp.]|nr:energy-coupling factor transporter transmembrane protein EcfT [Methanosphaera sp.]
MAYFLGYARNEGITLDPRTKLLLLIIINIIVFHKSDSQILSVISIFVVTSLFILNKRYKTAIYSLLGYLLYTVLLIFLLPYLSGILVYLFGTVLVIFYRMFPIFLMASYFILTTSVSEFVAAMEKMHMPQEIIIPLSVIFRFFPTVIEEIHSILDAMNMSGLNLNLKNILTRPLKILEYLFIPLIMSIVKTGDELSAAVLTRSMDNPIQRTNICEIGFKLVDIVYGIIGLLLVVGLFL